MGSVNRLLTVSPLISPQRKLFPCLASPSTHLCSLTVDIFLMCVSLKVCMCTSCMQVPAGQKRTSDPLELELQTVASQEGVMGVEGEKDQASLWRTGRAIPGHWVLRGQYAQLHLRSCSLIVFQVEVSSQRQTCQPPALHNTSCGAHAHSKRSTNFQNNNGTLSMNLSRRH